MNMKPFAILIIAALFASPLCGQEDSQIKNQILERFPQADRNKDGTLSDQELKAAKALALKRFPQLDGDGDGELSTSEIESMLKMAAARKKQLDGQSKKQRSNKKWAEKSIKPQHANVKYGDHERHTFDLWMAESKKPTPLAIYIHGGGFTSGSKEKLKEKNLKELLAAGISVAAINYRYRTIEPLPAAHHDARQALQFIRSKAKELNIDKERVGVFGGSAGAQISLWLALSDEMAKPESKNPIERESTRVTCVATSGGQASMEHKYWKKHVESFGLPFEDPDRLKRFGVETAEEADSIAKSLSALPLLSSDDPPMFLAHSSGPSKKPPTQPDRLRGFIVHHVRFGIDLKNKADELGVENHLTYPGNKSNYASNVEFLIDKLNAEE